MINHGITRCDHTHSYKLGEMVKNISKRLRFRLQDRNINKMFRYMRPLSQHKSNCTLKKNKKVDKSYEKNTQSKRFPLFKCFVCFPLFVLHYIY